MKHEHNILPHDYKEWAATPTVPIEEVVKFEEKITHLSDAAVILKRWMDDVALTTNQPLTTGYFVDSNCSHAEYTTFTDTIKELNRFGLVQYDQKSGEIKVL